MGAAAQREMLIVEHLTRYGGECTARQIGAATGIELTSLNYSLGALGAAGVVRRSNNPEWRTANKKSSRYLWRLA